MTRFDVIVLGVAVMDIVVSPVDRSIFDRDNGPVEQLLITPGGDAVNQAIRLSHLGKSTAIACRIGRDTLGDILLKELKAQGVDTSQAAVSTESDTTAAIALVSADGSRNLLYKRGNNFNFCLNDIDMGAVTNARALSVGSFFGMPKLEDDGLLCILQSAKEKDVITFADMGSDKKGLKLRGVAPFLPYVDYFLPSETESMHLTDGLTETAAARVFREAGAGNVIIKLGSRGVYADCAVFQGYIDAFDITPVDTTGAGDAFCAGFIHGILSGWELQRTINFASACGAYNALFYGASRAQLSIEKLQNFMSGTPKKHVR